LCSGWQHFSGIGWLAGKNSWVPGVAGAGSVTEMAALLLHSAWFRLAVVFPALLQLQSVGWLEKILEFQVLQLKFIFTG